MHNKGAAAIIATILLLTMAVAAAGVSYVWVMNMEDKIQKDTEEKYASDAAKTNAGLSIESMWKDGSNKINFILRNTGSYTFEDIARFSFYVDGVKKPDPTLGWSGAFPPGNLSTVVTGEDFPIYPGVPSKTIKVVSEKGTSVIYRCEITIAGQSYC